MTFKKSRQDTNSRDNDAHSHHNPENAPENPALDNGENQRRSHKAVIPNHCCNDNASHTFLLLR